MLGSIILKTLKTKIIFIINTIVKIIWRAPLETKSENLINLLYTYIKKILNNVTNISERRINRFINSNNSNLTIVTA
jgi:hypothetical protein